MNNFGGQPLSHASWNTHESNSSVAGSSIDPYERFSSRLSASNFNPRHGSRIPSNAPLGTSSAKPPSMESWNEHKGSSSG